MLENCAKVLLFFLAIIVIGLICTKLCLIGGVDVTKENFNIIIRGHPKSDYYKKLWTPITIPKGTSRLITPNDIAYLIHTAFMKKRIPSGIRVEDLYFSWDGENFTRVIDGIADGEDAEIRVTDMANPNLFPRIYIM